MKKPKSRVHIPHIPHPHIPHPHIPRPHGFLPHILDQYIHSKWAHYISQCGLASLSLILILVMGDILLRAAIVVGVASSAFTIFVIPESIAATPRKVVGGHLVAGLAGAAISFILQTPGLEIYAIETRYVLDVAAALSVGIGIFLMVVTNTEHPPAAACLLGLILNGVNFERIISILGAVILLILIRFLLINRLKNLI